MTAPSGGSGIVGSFIDALATLEQSGDAKPMAGLFAPDAELASLAKVERGPGAPEAFWSRYRSQFGEIRSDFSRVIEGRGASVLVWRSEGSLAGGRPIAYSGVSILELNGERIARFETYYDSAAFARAAVREAATEA